MSQELRFSQRYAVPPDQLYYALTNGAAIQAWMGNDVRSDPRPGGRFYVWWREGFYTAGEFLELNENEALKLRWQGKDEPAPSIVRMTLSPVGDGTELTVEHADLGSGADWQAAREALTEGWQNGLANLKSVVEDGLSLQLKNQPLLGISGGVALSPENAARLGVPSNEGFQITGIIADMGAATAGLQSDDVLVSLGGEPIKDWPTLQPVIAAHKAGDVVPIVFYRGAEKHKADLTFSARPILPIPESGQEIADEVAATYGKMLADLGALFTGSTEAAANHRPAAGEWNANEVLAHLIQVELWAHMALGMAVQGLQVVGYGNNWDPWIAATAASRPDTEALLAEYKRQCEVSVTMLAALPEEFLGRRYAYNNMGQMFALGLPNHTRSHFGQISAALKAGQAAAVPAD